MRVSRVYRMKHNSLGGDDVITKEQINSSINLLSELIDISVDFTKIDGITSNTVGLEAFQHMNVQLYHGWIVNPEDSALFDAVGTIYHDIFRADAAPPPIKIKNADQLVLEFINGTGLTTFGLHELHNSTENDQVFVLFWNRSFHTLVKHNGSLYVLQNDLSTYSKDIVWKEFNSVLGDGQLCTSNFTPAPAVRPALQVHSNSALTSSQVQLHKCKRPNCPSEFFSMVNSNRHDQVHLKDPKSKMGSMTKADMRKFWDELSHEEACNILSIKAMKIKHVNGDLLHAIIEKIGPGDEFYNRANRLKVMIGSFEKTPSDELFAVLNEGSEETAFSTDIRFCPEDVVSYGGIHSLRDVNNVFACCCYFLERNLVSSWFDHKGAEALKNAGILLEEEEAKSSHLCGRMSFEEYVKNNKLTKIYKIRPKNLFMLHKLDNAFKLVLVILTLAGRKCARGFLRWFVQNHREKKCWNGDWELSDMWVVNGQFIISKEATFELTADRVVEDLKRFCDLVLIPYYFNTKLACFPLYFDEFRSDILKVPDPIKKPDNFVKFEKYIALHLAFMPPLSRSTLLINLFKAYDSNRFVPDRLYVPLNHKTSQDWRKIVIHVNILRNVFFYNAPADAEFYEVYSPTFFHLLKFSRHYSVHDLDHTKVGAIQLVPDMIITDLVLGQLLAVHLADMIMHIIMDTNMEGRFFRPFQAFEASDGEVFLCAEDDADDSSDDE